MKKEIKRSIITSSITYSILTLLNLIRVIITHYCFTIPNCAKVAKEIENTGLNGENAYNFLATFYHWIYNSEIIIGLQVALLVVSVLVGIIYGIINARKDKNKNN